MAANDGQLLTNKQRVRLAASISKPNMKSIALGYFDLEREALKNLESENLDDTEAFNREVIERWEFRNSGRDQVKVRENEQWWMKVSANEKLCF